ncbi:hypothetical protein GCM10022205_25620 [Spinactinospora alkalitolerans]
MWVAGVCAVLLVVLGVVQILLGSDEGRVTIIAGVATGGSIAFHRLRRRRR